MRPERIKHHVTMMMMTRDRMLTDFQQLFIPMLFFLLVY